ncbi:MAG: hypothetical protein KBS70_06220 [Bacteroidales bacterium]|nr:hypothetical protein [Candidatus Colicola equi]
MKRLSLFLLLFFALLSCEKKHVEYVTKKYELYAFTEMTYAMMPYCGDSALITINITKVPDQPTFTAIQLKLGEMYLCNADTIPLVCTFPVYLNDDVTLNIEHLCYFGSNFYPIGVPITIHKGEIVTPNHDTTELVLPCYEKVTIEHEYKF